MATTDAKPGFRLPWNAERSDPEPRAETPGEAPIGEAVTPDQENETPDMIDAAPAEHDQMAAVDEGTAVQSTYDDSAAVDIAPAEEPSPVTEVASAGRKPNKFMADLTRAMQGAAETAKADTLARFSADAKAHIETIHAATAVEATELRKQADDDVASIRDWSKAEIARIREETDERITHRKERLEREIEAHAADIEARIERVQRRVDAFEADMAEFFQRLIAEDDATRFAAMAVNLPEPPAFDDMGAETFEATVETTVETEAATEAEFTGSAETHDVPAERAVVLEPWPDAPDETYAEAVAETVGAPEAVDTADAETLPAEAQADGWDAADGSTATDDTETPEFDAAALDPRVVALGLTPDLYAAEVEAAAFTPEETLAEDDIPVIGDDALAARLAGLVPDVDNSGSDAASTRVVVTGLISVASIAGFKRQLSRVAGVQSVGVSSGPDGEFLFSVIHDAGIALRDAVTTLPGFGARVTADADGELTVTARDPETEG